MKSYDRKNLIIDLYREGKGCGRGEEERKRSVVGSGEGLREWRVRSVREWRERDCGGGLRKR
jgi:hypothetical protein